MHEHGMQESGRRDLQTGEQVIKPLSVLDYNQHMGAVMQLSFNETARKSMKWDKKLFFHLLDVTVRNAYILKH